MVTRYEAAATRLGILCFTLEHKLVDQRLGGLATVALGSGGDDRRRGWYVLRSATSAQVGSIPATGSSSFEMIQR